MSESVYSISLKDKRSLAQVDALLRQEGISRDGNLDYICGMFDEDDALVATGSCFRNTIRCLAVSHTRQGEGLLNQVVSHLMEEQARRGNFHVFLYTKPESSRFFGDLGFFEIARVPGKLVFMENRRRGFSDFCGALAPKHTPGKTAALVMNANPFTLGHRFLAEQAAKENDTVHLFVLAEEAGPIPAKVRWELVQEGVKDLPNVCPHLSGPYMISSATFPSYFLRDADDVILTQAALDAQVFLRIAAELGIQTRYLGQEPFSHVTALYNEVLRRELPAGGVALRILPRLESDGVPISASKVRQAIAEGRLETLRAVLPETTYGYFASPASEAVRKALEAEKDIIHY